MAEDLIRFLAVVRPQKAEALFERLVDCQAVVDFHGEEVRGPSRSHPGGPGLSSLPKVAIHGVVWRSGSEEVASIISSIAGTGRSGDGKIMLSPVQGMVDLGPLL